MVRWLFGTQGSDTLAATDEATLILGFGGDDRLDGGAGNDSVIGGQGRDLLRGDGAGLVTEDPASQAGGNDLLYGESGDDTLLGGGGDDMMIGGAGQDLQQGGFGRDILVGGAGADRFAFGTIVFYGAGTPSAFLAASPDTGLGPAGADLILDFSQGKDLIDLSVINYFARRPPTDFAFTFLGEGAFTATPGRPELRYEIVGDQTVIQMDGTLLRSPDGIQPDGQPDAEIILAGVHHLTAQDFVL